jgi:hypothetical protein
MDAAIQFYPFNCLDLIRLMSRDHWFVRGYNLLSRRPTRAELLMVHPPFGLIHDEDWEEEMQLREFLARRMDRRRAQAAVNVVSVPQGEPPWLQALCYKG